MKQLLLSLEHYHQRFFPLLRCLFHLTKTLPNAPLGRKVGGRDSYRLGLPLFISLAVCSSTQLHELYNLSLEHTVTEDEKFRTAWSLLRSVYNANGKKASGGTHPCPGTSSHVDVFWVQVWGDIVIDEVLCCFW